MSILRWAWNVALDWHLPFLLAFGPLFVLELHHLAERRRARRMQWAQERRALRRLRAIQPPRSIP